MKNIIMLTLALALLILPAKTILANEYKSSFPEGLVYRFWNTKTFAHFYTTDIDERDYLILESTEWEYEDGVFITDSYTGQDCISGTEVFRFYSPEVGVHFYTADASEKEYIIKTNPNWDYETIAFCASIEVLEGYIAVHQFWSDSRQAHMYTTDYAEKAYIESNLSAIYKYEGIVFFVKESSIDSKTERAERANEFTKNITEIMNAQYADQLSFYQTLSGLIYDTDYIELYYTPLELEQKLADLAISANERIEKIIESKESLSSLETEGIEYSKFIIERLTEGYMNTSMEFMNNFILIVDSGSEDKLNDIYEAYLDYLESVISTLENFTDDYKDLFNTINFIGSTF